MQGEGLAGHAVLHFDGLQEIAIRRGETWGPGEDLDPRRRCGVTGSLRLERLKGKLASIPSIYQLTT